MAKCFNFENPVFNRNTGDIYQEYELFKQHVEFVFKGLQCKSEAKDHTIGGDYG